jgi:antitoxin PrlF
MSGTTAGKHPGPRPVSARARLRPKSQLTLPEEIRRALRVNEGDEVEFRVGENGTITVRGYTSIPTDHALFYTAQQSARQASERESAERQATTHESADALIRLDAQETPDI